MDKLASMIVGGMSDKPEEKEPDHDPFEALASEVVSGMKEGNASMVAKSLKAFFDMCESEPHEEGSNE